MVKITILEVGPIKSPRGKMMDIAYLVAIMADLTSETWC